MKNKTNIKESPNRKIDRILLLQTELQAMGYNTKVNTYDRVYIRDSIRNLSLWFNYNGDSIIGGDLRGITAINIYVGASVTPQGARSTLRRIINMMEVG